MSFKERILNKSDSYIFYKSNYKKLKSKLKKSNNDKELYLKKKIIAQKKLAKYTKPIIIDKLNNEDYSNLTISIKSPHPKNNPIWGDYFFAKSLKKSFEKMGFKVIIQAREEWYDDTEVDIVIVLRGLQNYEPNHDEINVMWNISHPDLVTFEEYEKYDIVFLASETYANQLKSKLNTVVEPLLQCTDPEIFFRKVDDGYAEDILFVGSTRSVFRQIVKDTIKTNHDVSVYGKGWEKFIDNKYFKKDFIPNEELHKYYSSCKILLNDHWEDMVELDFPSNRLFDALACGTFVLSDNVPSIEKLFEGNVATYENISDLNEKLDYYLNNPNECESMGLNGKKIVLEKHTFDNRRDSIVKSLTNIKIN